MTNQDLEAFGRMMFALGDTFNEPVSEIRAEAYFEALKRFPIADVLAAGRRALEECRYFPRPVELREMLDGTDDEQAERAWNIMRQLVRSVGFYGVPTWPDDAIRRAALDLYGGWQALCSNLPSGHDDTGPALLGARKAFIANYKAYAGLERRERIALPASDERQRLIASARRVLES